MENKNGLNSLRPLAPAITLGAMILAALSAEVLEGIPQAIVLAICVGAMSAGILSSLFSQMAQRDTAQDEAVTSTPAVSARTRNKDYPLPELNPSVRSRTPMTEKRELVTL